MRDKPILCVDFDGVIHSYSSGWHGATVILDPPVPGAIEWLWRATKHFNVQIYSSRSKDPEAREAMAQWLRMQAVSELDPPEADALIRDVTVAYEKPAAFLTIDDRAVCFEGDWTKVDPKKLLAFKPWNKRLPPGLGATGEFPYGKVQDDDEGELRMAVGFDKVDGIVRLEFGKPVAWLGLPPAEAVNLARSLLRHAGASKVEISFGDGKTPPSGA
jgi:hypothetical protein